MAENAAIHITVAGEVVLKQFRALIESAKKQYKQNTNNDPWQLILALVNAADTKGKECSLFRETAQQMFLEMEVERDGPDDNMPQTAGTDVTVAAETVLSSLDHATLKILTDSAADEIDALVDMEWAHRGLTRDQV